MPITIQEITRLYEIRYDQVSACEYDNPRMPTEACILATAKYDSFIQKLFNKYSYEDQVLIGDFDQSTEIFIFKKYKKSNKVL